MMYLLSIPLHNQLIEQRTTAFNKIWLVLILIISFHGYSVILINKEQKFMDLGGYLVILVFPFYMADYNRLMGNIC